MSRLLWHLFGGATSLVFVVGLDLLHNALMHPSLLPVLDLSALASAIVALLGFLGIVRYVWWYRS